MNKQNPVIEIPKQKLEKVAADPVKSARLFQLVYINQPCEGITRTKFRGKFRYYLNGEEVKDEFTLTRIKKLAIPPAWENVWICKDDNGHLQATGIDVLGRKQYRYHPHWNKMRSETKFFRLYEFGKQLPSIRQQLQKDIALAGLPLNKILAAMLLLMEKTSIRIGNSFYEKLYGSFGLTTLKNKHVDVKGNTIRFAFKGKKGVQHQISLRSKRLSNIIKSCLEIPGKELFQYYDDHGNRQPVESGMLNDYIHQLSGSEFSSKDFRTWTGTLYALAACIQKGDCEDEKQLKHKTVEVFEEVSKQLGNTRTVCKKYYVHPIIPELFEKRELKKYLENLPETEPDNSLYSPEEKILMKILKDHSQKTKVIEIPRENKPDKS